MSIWSSLFTSNKVVDGVIKAGDALVFTPEERKAMFIEQLGAYEAFKIAQRMLMLTVCPTYVLMSLVVFLAMIFDVGNPEGAIEVLQGYMGWAFVGIVGFYTGGGAVEGGIKAWGNK